MNTKKLFELRKKKFELKKNLCAVMSQPSWSNLISVLCDIHKNNFKK